MNRRLFQARLWWRSLAYRPGTGLWAAAALMLVAAFGSFVLQLRGDVGGQMERTFRQQGALYRLVLASPGDAAADGLRRVLQGGLAGEQNLGFAIQRKAAAVAGGKEVEIIGVEPETLRPLVPYWVVRGRWPAGPAECLAGADVPVNGDGALTLRPAAGDAAFSCRVTGRFTSGDEDDAAVIAPALPHGFPPTATVALLSVSARGTAALERSVRQAGLRARLEDLGAFRAGEAQILRRAQILLDVTSAFVFALLAAGVAALLRIRLDQRRRELALHAALGATPRRIQSLVVGEALLLASAAGLAGAAAGTLLAGRVEARLFGLPAPPQWTAAAGGLLLCALMALAAAALVCRSVLRRSAAHALQGGS